MRKTKTLRKGMKWDRRMMRWMKKRIGLAAVRNLVESYGGTISVRSRPGVGSIFEFTLPAVPGSSVRISRKR